MGAYAINDTSEIHIDDQHLTIRITRRACASWIWEQITELVQAARERLGNGSAEGVGIMPVPLARPWRYRALDWLSQVVYPLLIPTDHFLARLDRLISCAPPVTSGNPASEGDRPGPLN